MVLFSLKLHLKQPLKIEIITTSISISNQVLNINSFDYLTIQIYNIIINIFKHLICVDLICLQTHLEKNKKLLSGGEILLMSPQVYH